MTQAVTDDNNIPQRCREYDSSDRAKQLVQKSFAMDSLFSGVWPSQWSTPEAPEFHKTWSRPFTGLPVRRREDAGRQVIQDTHSN